MPKATLFDTWIYAGKTYLPGEHSDIPQEAYDALAAKGALAPPAEEAPVAPSESGELWPFLSDEQRQSLADAGYTSQDALNTASDDDLLSLPAIGAATVRKLRGGA